MTPPRNTSRRRVRSLRMRILGWYAALLALAIGADVVLRRAVLLRRLDNEISQAFDRARQELSRLTAGHNPQTGQPLRRRRRRHLRHVPAPECPS